jgi:hypothetical protein
MVIPYTLVLNCEWSGHIVNLLIYGDSHGNPINILKSIYNEHFAFIFSFNYGKQ